MAEKEYIEREKAKQRLVHDYAYAAANILDEIPAADVVQVVRCKDCKHRYVPTRCALWYGTVNGKEYFVERGEDFYCSYGERGNTK